MPAILRAVGFITRVSSRARSSAYAPEPMAMGPYLDRLTKNALPVRYSIPASAPQVLPATLAEIPDLFLALYLSATRLICSRKPNR